MNKQAIYTIISFLLLASGCAAPTHIISLKVNTDPPGGWILKKGTQEDSIRFQSGEYFKVLTAEDLSEGCTRKCSSILTRFSLTRFFGSMVREIATDASNTIIG